MPTKFGEIWTLFGPSIIEFLKSGELKNSFWARAEFFVSPVEPAPANESTSDQGFAHICVLGFLAYCTDVGVLASSV